MIINWDAAWRVFLAEHTEVIGWTDGESFTPLRPGPRQIILLRQAFAAYGRPFPTLVYGWKRAP